MDFIKDFSLDKVRNLAEDAYNQAKPKTDLEKKIYEVLSHKNWGSSSTLLNEIARDTNDYDKFPVITKMMWEAMDNRPAAWRIVFKSLTLLEHLIKNGSERCVDDARSHTHTLRSLDNFNYYEGTVDRGLGVREKSKQIRELMEDDERIREEREKAKQLRNKFGGMSNASSSGGYSGYGNDSYSGGGGGGGGGGFSDKGSGYGNSGIDSYSEGMSKGFSGRYSDQDSSSNTATSSAVPTFASLPEETDKPKKTSKPKKLKKKKKKEATVEKPPAAAPAEDLFSFDSPAPAPTDDDGFGAFDSAPAQVPTSAPVFDAFSNPAPAPAPVPTPAVPAAFDAFASVSQPAPKPSPANTTFDAFGSAPTNNAPMNQMGNMGMMQQPNQMGNMGMMQQPNQMGNMGMMQQPNQMGSMGMMQQQNQMGNMGMMQQQNQMGNMGMMQQQNQMNMMQQKMQMMNMMGNPNSGMSTMQGAAMGGNKNNTPKKVEAADDDDFGDFSGANKNQSSGGSVDPMSKLIQLDSLTMNKKKEDKTSEPVIYNAAAATAMKTKQSMENTVNPALSFSNIDGLNKTVNISMPTPTSNRQPGQPIMAQGGNNGMQGGVGMNSGTGMSMGMNQQQQGMMNGGMMGGNQAYNMMGNQMGGNQQNNMMGNQMNMGMSGMNNQAMGGNGMSMGSINGMGGMNNNNMSGMGGGTMGGQPMGGWQ